MNTISRFPFFRAKYGSDLLIDVVELKYARRFLRTETVHTLVYYDITLITEGEGCFSIDEDTGMVKPGDVIFSRPGEIRCWDIRTIRNGYALIFEEEFLLSFFNDPEFLGRLCCFRPGRIFSRCTLRESIYGRILSLMMDIQKEIATLSRKDDHLLRALLYEALILLDRSYQQEIPLLPDQATGSNPYVNRFLNLVNQYYKQEHQVEFYASQLCITTKHLSRRVKETTGKSAKKIIQERILTEAKRLLRYTDLSVAEIAETLSYENDSYFIRFFRLNSGVTPHQYRHHYKA
ncbi:MAG: AraC family transcriptional regulator [Bacteroides sp.]|nr:AraC family transcriptional regulator [Bacteroides sp.]